MRWELGTSLMICRFTYLFLGEDHFVYLCVTRGITFWWVTGISKSRHDVRGGHSMMTSELGWEFSSGNQCTWIRTVSCDMKQGTLRGKVGVYVRHLGFMVYRHR